MGFKVGDKVVLVSLDNEVDYRLQPVLGKVGTVCEEADIGEAGGYEGEYQYVAYPDCIGALNPWTKNLQPAKSYYIKQFKEIYGKV